MGSPLRRVSGFFRELKRRKVYQVTLLYLVLVVGGLELLDVLIPATNLPDWASPLILSLAIVGLPTVIVLAWTFDITPAGVVKTVGEADSRPTEAVPDDGADADRAGDDAPAALDPLSVAVLPFDNLSGAEDAEPFAFGIHDDLITELSRASALTVISRTSVRGYRGTDKGIREVARELGVGTVVEGGVQKSGDRVRLNIQVIDARTDTHRWAERYDCELSAETIFDLQSRLATKIMEELEAHLTAAELARRPDRPTDDLEAYRLYAMGREAGVDRSAEGLRRAIRRFEEAIECDPSYAQAWAGLGMALIMLVGYGHDDAEELVARGSEACNEAVRLGPELPEALAALGNLHGHLQNAPAALSALDEAIRLGPGLAIGYQRASWIHLMAGDPRAAARNAGRAVQLAPLEPEARANLAMAHLAMGDHVRAAQEARRALQSHPEFSYARWVLALALLAAGATEDAGAQLWTIHEERYRPWAILVDGLASEAGDEAVREAYLRELRESGAPFKIAVLHAEWREPERAIPSLEEAWPLFWDDQLVLRYYRVGAFGELREDPRFAALLLRLDRSWGLA